MEGEGGKGDWLPNEESREGECKTRRETDLMGEEG
jgi:hypothetical protein